MNTTDYFRQRRTVRRYTDQDIPAGLLDELLDSAQHAPTTGNMQLYSVVVTTSPELLGELAKCHFCQPASTGCKALLTFCVDFNRFEHWCRLSNAKPGYGNLQSLMMGVMDTVIFAQQFVTAAEMAGLGTCYLGTTTYTAKDISRLLGLPKRVVPIITVSVGYPAEEPDDCGRLPLKGVMHSEVYHDYSDDDIREIYAEKEARPDSHGFVTENGKETLAQVFTDVRYPQGMLEEFSGLFADLLKASGF